MNNQSQQNEMKVVGNITVKHEDGNPTVSFTDNNQCTIANKEVGVATHLIHNLNSTGNNQLSKKRFVANNGRCTLVSPIDKNTSGQPQPFIVLQLNGGQK